MLGCFLSLPRVSAGAEARWAAHVRGPSPCLLLPSMPSSPFPRRCSAPADTDAALAKMRLNWRTALVLAELELEIEALAQGRQHRQQLKVGLGLGHASAALLLGAAAWAAVSRPWH